MFAEQIIDLLLINLIVIIVWLRLGIPQQFADWLVTKSTKGVITHAVLRKPFGCELCSCFWLSLGYCFVDNFSYTFSTLHGFLVTFAVCLVNALLVQYLNAIIEKIKQFAIKYI